MNEDSGRRILVYCLRGAGPGAHILLNRFYKPIGMPNVPYIDYASHPARVVVSGLTAKRRARISVHGPGGSLWLYHDDCPPWAGKAERLAYYERLDALMELTFQPVSPE